MADDISMALAAWLKLKHGIDLPEHQPQELQEVISMLKTVLEPDVFQDAKPTRFFQEFLETTLPSALKDATPEERAALSKGLLSEVIAYQLTALLHRRFQPPELPYPSDMLSDAYHQALMVVNRTLKEPSKAI